MILIAGPTSIPLLGLLEGKIARNQRRQILKKSILGPTPEIRNSQSRSIRRYQRVRGIEFFKNGLIWTDLGRKRLLNRGPS